MRISKCLSQSIDSFHLIINQEVYETARQSAEFAAFMSDLEVKQRLIILPSLPQAFRTKPLQALAHSLYLWQVVKKFNISILHTVLGGMTISWLAILTGTPVQVIEEVTTNDDADSRLGGRLRFIFRHVDLIHAVSPSVAKRLSHNFKQYGVEAEMLPKLVCAPIPFFVPPNQTVSEEKEKLIVFCARFIDRKNPILFANAIKIFLKGRNDWRAIMLGAGVLEPQLRRILDAPIKSGQAEVKHVDDVYAVFNKSAIFVSLIHPDNYPSQSLIEAMYMSNAVIATDAGDTKRLVNSQNGLLVRYDQDSVLQALFKLADHWEHTLEMGRESRDLIKSEFLPDKYIEHLLSMYEGLSDGNKG